MKFPLFPICCAAFAGMNVAALAGYPVSAPASAAAASPSASVAPAAPVAKPTPVVRDENTPITPAIKDSKRHTDFLNRIQDGEIDVLFLGDSITDFWPRRGEVSWLKFAPYHPANFGISGDRTEHLLWRVQNGELEGFKPKVTVIMIGTNNVGAPANDKPEWAANGVKKIVETVQEKLPQTKILLLGVFPRGAAGSAERKQVENLNKLIAPLGDGKTVRYMDISKVFLDAQGELIPETMADTVHPSAKGYDGWYAAIQPVLDEMMK